MEAKNNKIDESRPLAYFHPSVWGDRFLTLPVSDINEAAINDDRQEFESLKLKVKEGLEEASTDYMRLLQMVDAILRLGIGYHFEEEIDRALENTHETFSVNYCSNNHDLYATSLSFRLLRQHGYKVPCDVFKKFKIPKGDFAKDNPDAKEVMGLLEFYEATHLRVHGEDILDQGFVIARDYLEAILPDLSDSSPVAEQVHRALKYYSIRRGLPRLETRHYISMYDKLYASHHEGLLKLSKMDFNMVQSLHRRELSKMCRWWKDLEVETKLSYARDRIVETYFWITGIYFEPEYSFARKIMTRAQGLLSIMDDTYDAYGTYEELKIFTEAMERWSYSCLEQLPEYLKTIYRACLELFSEIEEEMAKQGISYRICYGIEAMKFACRAYFAEVKWRHEKYTPTTEEYLETATASGGFTPLIIISLLGMGDVVTKEAFDWVFSNPKMVDATLVISRLADDISSFEFEAKRDHIPSVVQCYMEEHNVTKQKAIDVFKDQIEDAWKDINEGFIRPAKFPAPILYRILNHARIMEVLYSRGDWYTHVGPEMKGFIKQLFIDPV